MIIIGIDFSINSTAVVIKDGKDSILFSVVPNYIKGRAAFKAHDSLSEFINIISYEKTETVKNPMLDQSIKLKNADRLSNAIMYRLSYYETVDEIRIEGFSYASKGNSFIDLIMFNSFLKLKLIQKFGHVISVVPPKTLKKKFTGNGNATKCDMIRSFVEDKKTPFKSALIDMGFIQAEGEFKVPKPIDDIVDAIGLTTIEL